MDGTSEWGEKTILGAMKNMRITVFHETVKIDRNNSGPRNHQNLVLPFCISVRQT